MSGVLILIPVGLGPGEHAATHPPEVLRQVHSLSYFIVERAKSARAEIRRLGHPAPLQSLNIAELPEKPDLAWIDKALAAAQQGMNIGLMSEAGCPAVADPGALIVRRAHELGIRVLPLVGPSSLLLGLMASGLNGQSFAFQGYLPAGVEERNLRIRSLEKESARLRQTQLFIETPYRNEAMFDSLLAHCQDQTLLCIARALSTSEEWIYTARIGTWKKKARPDLSRLPSVFLLLAGT